MTCISTPEKLYSVLSREISYNDHLAISMMCNIPYDRSVTDDQFVTNLKEKDLSIRDLIRIFEKTGRLDIANRLKNSPFFNQRLGQIFAPTDETEGDQQQKYDQLYDQYHQLREQFDQLQQENQALHNLNQELLRQTRNVKPKLDSSEEPLPRNVSVTLSGHHMVELSQSLDRQTLLMIREMLYAQTNQMVGNGAESPLEWLIKAGNMLISKSQIKDAILACYESANPEMKQSLTHPKTIIENC